MESRQENNGTNVATVAIDSNQKTVQRGWKESSTKNMPTVEKL